MVKMVLYKTVNHFFPLFNNWLREIKDPRNKESIEYSLPIMIWIGLLLFMLKLGSRRQINFQLNKDEMLKNMPYLVGEDIEKIAHGDTLNYLASRLSSGEVSRLRIKMIRRLIRMRAIERYRLKGQYLIGIDGTGHLVFKERHCDYCLKKEYGGKTIYYHMVLEAKLILGKGKVLSIGTEFIENQGEEVDIQDCELKAFHRLVGRLKKDFPQLNICLLLDGLYANERVFEACKRNRWKYIITFKEGSMPATYEEYEGLKRLSPENTLEYEDKDLRQEYAWINDIDYNPHLLNVLECKETKFSKEKTFVWITNFRIDEFNVQTITNKGGRLRWQIEEGFNMQKNGGYNLEHPYSKDIVGSKNFYLFMQIAHIFNLLMENSNLLTVSVKKLFGSIRNFSRRLLEDLRTSVFDPAEIEAVKATTFQIRLHSP